LAFTLRGINRLGLWIILIVFSVTLLAFPTHLTYEYTAIQSTRIFQNFPLFAVLYCIWLVVLLVLLFSNDGEGEGNWEKLALVCVFSAVFLGFWTISTFNVGLGEGMNNIAHIKYLDEVGKITTGLSDLPYFDFPGLHIIGSFVSQITGIDPIRSASLIVFSQAIGLSVLLYVLFKYFLNNTRFAALAVLLVVQGNIWIAKLNIFHPRNIGLVLLATFLVLSLRYKDRLFGTVPSTILVLIVVAATTVTHFVTCILLFFIMLGIYLVQKIARGSSAGVYVSTLIIFIFLPLTWAIYWATTTFGFTIQTALTSLQAWLHGVNNLWTILMMTNANLGGAMPLWSDITRMFWLILIYGFGSIIGLWNLFRMKKSTRMENVLNGMLLGIIMVSVISTVTSTGGERFDTYILYGAFITVPIILWFLLHTRNPIGKYSLICLAFVFFALSFPTFLTHNNMIEETVYYPDEHALGEFLESTSTAEPNIYFTEPESPFLMAYYTPNALFYRLNPIPAMKDAADLWTGIEQLENSFESWADQPVADVVFPMTKRSTTYYQHFFDVGPDNYKWQELKDSLSANNTIYDSGNIQIYSVRFISNSSESGIPSSIK